MCSGVSDWALLSPSRVSPFGNPRITVRLPTPRGLSQVPTSFIGSWCQGIHRVPLLTWPQRCSRPLCSSQGTGGPATWSAPAATRMSRAGLGACVQRRFTGVSVRVPARRPVREVGRCPFPQDPTACRSAAPASLTVPPSAPRTRRRSTRRGRLIATPTNRCSTLELPLRNDRPKWALDAPRGARCSLERR
jgi:hypothetical protein